MVPAMSLTHWLYVSIHNPPISVVADASCHSVAGYDVLASISRLLDYNDLVCFHSLHLL